MAQTDGQIIIQVSLEDKEAKKGLKNIDKETASLDKGSAGRFKNVASGLKTIALAAVGAATAVAGIKLVQKLKEFGVEAIKAAGAAQAMTSQFSQVFGELEAEATKALNAVAVATGILPERLKGSFTMMAAFAKTTGMDTASALALTERATLAAADSAAFYDKSIEEVTENLQSFLKGNFENDAALGISATETTRNAKANELYGKSFIKLSESQKQLTLLAMVEDGNKLSGALGQAARETDGLENVVGNLKQAWENLKVAFGTPILDIAIQAMKGLTELINNFDTGPIIAKIEVAVAFIKETFDTLVPIVKDVLSAMSDFWQEHGSVIIDIVGMSYQNVFDIITGIATALAPLVLESLEVIKGLWQENGTGILSNVQGVYQTVRTTIQNVLSTVLAFIKEQLQTIVAFMKSDGDQIMQAVKNVFNFIKSVVEFVMPAVKFIIEMVWGAIKDIITGALNIIMGAIKIFSGLFTGDFSKMWEGIKQLFSGAIKLIMGWLTLSFFGGIRTIFVNLGKTVVNLVKSKWTTVVNVFKNMGSTATNFVSSMVRSVINFFKNLFTQGVKAVTDLGTTVINIFKNLGKGMIDAIKNIPSQFIQIGKDIMQGLINGLKALNPLNAIKETVGGLVSGAKELLGIRSPSRVFMEFGRFISEGLAIGITDSYNKVQAAVKAHLTDTLRSAAAIAKSANEVVYQSNLKSQNEIVALEKAAATEKAKIVQAANDKIQKLRNAEAKKKKKDYTTLNTKIREIEKKATEDQLKLSQTTADKIAAVNKKQQATNLTALKAHYEAKKEAGDVSLKDEMAYWQKSLTYFKKGTKEHTEVLKLYNKAVIDYNKERLDNVKNYISEKKNLDQLTLKDEVIIWEQTLATFEEGSNEYLEVQKAYKTALDALYKEITSINESYQAKMQSINDNYLKLMQEQNDRYENEFNRLVSLYTNFAGSFDDFVVEYDVSSEQLITSMTNQLAAMDQYRMLFSMLSSRGVSDDLLDEISSMGVKALPELQALVSMTDSQLTQYSNMYDEKARKAREMATAELVGLKEDTEHQIQLLHEAANVELTALQADWQAQIKALTTSTKTELSSLQQIGKDAGQGLLNGLSAMQGPIVKKATEIANAIKATIQSALDIHSPSRWMRDFVAGNLAKGFTEGVSRNAQNFKKAASNIGTLIKGDIVNPFRNASMGLGGVAKPSISSITNSNVSNHNDQSRKVEMVNHYYGQNQNVEAERQARRLQFMFGG